MESEPLSPASRKPRGSQPRGSVSSIIQATPELQTVQSLHLEEMKVEAEAFHGEMGRAQIDFTSEVLGKDSVNDVIELTRSCKPSHQPRSRQEEREYRRHHDHYILARQRRAILDPEVTLDLSSTKGVTRQHSRALAASWTLLEDAKNEAEGCMDKFLKRSRIFSAIQLSARALVTLAIFDRFILVVIIVNSIFMAIDEYAYPELVPLIRAVDIVCLIIFTAEMFLKMIAYGIIGRNSYFSSSWNLLDAAVVISGWASMDLQEVLSIRSNEASDARGGSNLSALRTVRILRPLRTINRFKGMKNLVRSLASSLPMLVDSLFLFIFVLFIFAIVGVQIYNGAFRRQCFGLTGEVLMEDRGLTVFCSMAEDGCPAGALCARGTNPNDGWTSFDLS